VSFGHSRRYFTTVYRIHHIVDNIIHIPTIYYMILLWLYLYVQVQLHRSPSDDSGTYSYYTIISFISIQTKSLYRLPISNNVYECTEVNHNVIKIIIRIEYHIIYYSYVTLYATKVLLYFYFLCKRFNI